MKKLAVILRESPWFGMRAMGSEIELAGPESSVINLIKHLWYELGLLMKGLKPRKITSLTAAREDNSNY
ncbi:hypothetical protein TNCT_724761 [Trichonephila clavata]|uniref:Uncharacterized protein n=1 Tax=Trichonephila clavata TaxID=2740835 RepID=A0A8X6LKN4_TRICU|nr:hypothetical protein TNCT_724761 [Trichonephila clavata]